MDSRALIDSIMPDIERYVIKNGQPHIILEGYEYMREVITLYAKQHNLVESTLVLIDRGHNEEAYVLARSILNNYFLIGYLLNDNENRDNLKEYHVQPYISGRYYWRNVKKIMERPTIKNLEEQGVELPFTKKFVKEKIKENINEIKRRGFGDEEKSLSILKLANNSDEKGLELYATFYAEASKYEHSDVTTLEIYKQPIHEEWLPDNMTIDDYPRDRVFVLDMDKTNEGLKSRIYAMILSSYVQTFIRIVKLITEEEPHLKQMFNQMKLREIMSKILLFGKI